MGPRGLPRDVLARLNAELVKTMALPDVRQRFSDLGATPTATTPEQLKAFTADEVKRWAEVIKQSGAKVE